MEINEIKYKKQPVESITLTFDMDELIILRAFTGNVSGSGKFRRKTNEIYHKLSNIDVVFPTVVDCFADGAIILSANADNIFR